MGSKQQLLIVGAGMATGYLLNALSAQEHELEITVFGREAELCYNRVLLSSALAGEVSLDDLKMLNDSAVRGVTFHADTIVSRIDTTQRFVHCDTGSCYAYDKLVVATGSNVSIQQASWADIEGVRFFRTLQDTHFLRKRADDAGVAVVVGGGLLGLEAAHGLNALGHATTVVHRNAHLMNRQLDAVGATQLRADLEERGIGFSLKCTLAEVLHKNGRVVGVLLNDGQILPCDLLLFATGITPNVSVAQTAGLECDKGILVNAHMGSSADQVYALGECAQWGNHCVGLVAPIRAQADVLSSVLCGKSTTQYAVQDAPTHLKVSGIDIYRAGELDDAAEQLVFRDKRAGVYRRLIVRQNKLVGAVLVGDKQCGNWYADLIRSSTDISGIRGQLMFGPALAQALAA
ncbi:MAG: nitrite reductase (NADH) large subunit [Halioglobus sp.]|jgi:nitrite reductase (NADH) large subunit